jgi:hypothetical protein
MALPAHVKTSPYVKQSRDGMAAAWRRSRRENAAVARLLWRRHVAARKTLLANEIAAIYGGEIR